MFTTLSSTARAVTYYLLALGGCVALCLVVPGRLAAGVVMLSPAVAVLLMQLVVTRDGWHRAGWSGLGLGRLRHLGRGVWPVAFLAAPLILLSSEAAVRLTGVTTWQLASASDSALLLVGLLTMPLFCFVEEIGWRGYLTPLMARGTRRAPHLLTGLLHGIWHLPLVFLVTGAYLTDGSRWVVVPVFLAVLTCSGPVYAWTRLASGSVWPAVVLHSLFNWLLGASTFVVVTDDPAVLAELGREAGVFTLVAVAAVALWSATWPLPGDRAAGPVGTPVSTPVVRTPVTHRA